MREGVYARKRTFDWLGNWLHFDISSFEKTENVCGVSHELLPFKRLERSSESRANLRIGPGKCNHFFIFRVSTVKL